MIKKTFITFLIVFIAYTAFIIMNPKLGSSQNQWQENIVKGQRYLYDNSETIKSIIVGSSLSRRIIMDSLPSFYNLSFAGQSIFDGLRIIKNKNTLPKNVFIETNVILLKENEEFIRSLFSPIPHFLRKYIVSFRSDKQPIALIIQGLKNVRKNHGTHPNSESSKFQEEMTVDSKKSELHNDEVYHNMLNVQKSEYSKEPDKELVKSQFDLLSEYIQFFQDQGVNVVLFEMPIDSSLVNFPYCAVTRNAINQRFLQNRTKFIMPDRINYKTTDGLHLSLSEALNYTRYFISQIR